MNLSILTFTRGYFIIWKKIPLNLDRNHTIISRSLYIFNPLFKGQFHLFKGLYSALNYVRLVFKRGLWFRAVMYIRVYCSSQSYVIMHSVGSSSISLREPKAIWIIGGEDWFKNFQVTWTGQTPKAIHRCVWSASLVLTIVDLRHIYLHPKNNNGFHCTSPSQVWSCFAIFYPER